MEIIEKAPAKINLGLDVLYKRNDGYHELEMIMASIDLADRLTFTKTESNDITITTNSGFLPTDRKNNIFQAIEAMKKRYAFEGGVHVNLQKNIPVAAGLGGGSSDAAATFRGINRLFDLEATLEEMTELAIPIGTDIPFCLKGETALVTGLGEIVTPLKRPIPQSWVVLVKPKISVSTPRVFSKIDVDTLTHPNIKALQKAIEDNNYTEMTQHLGNSLESYTMKKFPVVKMIKEKMLDFGVDAAVMSGSGPTVIALCDKHSRAIHIANSLKGFCQEVYVVRTLNQ
ncbi:4-(cytidine 5'-diphospho)-2-C-methyl-D-erythritol kinase [Vagococcus fluvialis]|uniref:4-diphosphocytidyl-2-C-methyl-D-erythritol kinase n=1 Tax=Vagococcus fluvialis TaxID=2738 RepID=A0A369B5R3_9ENTE|nr:4-(cytidine 5'-diphospho)-2-C-methyl-D-erythritol kinase [Vagococcus fluvialis]RCX15024.1 4-diphosphocytidyl-2-C-methyl-D-erythritol kinase [Vagococcus fluvialis]RSU05689.1 4-(cytidine 5'-diphospho)-2-C-methyl-D-erythritol kinase [Vagococcus fluvialis]WNF90094.1 4-(cytidine 5'-diphospho)-2-C-methyl-D-erythritol kinase [Vagococcus fluvialis]